jgi:two-component system cell cycle response regulator
MRNDDQLQPNVIATLYLLGAAVMLLLSIQNYRYGLFPLVYCASIIMVILLGLGLHARIAFENKHLNSAAIWGLGVCITLTLWESIDHATQVKHWTFALALLAFVALNHRQAMILTSVTAGLMSLSLLLQESMVDTLSFAMSFTLLIALASTYAKLQQQRNRTLVELEIRDPMTGAYNYRHLEDTVVKEICRSDRTGKALSLIALEVDYSPQLLDLHGTLTSNDLLYQLSESLRSMIRAGDSQYFDSQFTFYLLLPCTPSEGVVVIAERIRRTIEKSNWPVVDSITVSIGCTTYVSNDQELSATRFVNDANIALVEAQKNGHNRVCHH